jgi:hypothetical protein
MFQQQPPYCVAVYVSGFAPVNLGIAELRGMEKMGSEKLREKMGSEWIFSERPLLLPRPHVPAGLGAVHANGPGRVHGGQ